MSIKAVFSLSVFIIAALLCACTETIKSYPTLVNEGLLTLHTTNPYVGSNLFLGREAELSPLLHNFLQRRGGPTAIEIIDEQFKRPRLLMFYPRDQEVYVADLVVNDKSYEWVVRAPYPISREDFRRLQHMDASLLGEPIFMINGKATRFRYQSDVQVAKVLKPMVPTPAPAKPTPKKVTRSKPAATDPHKVPPTPKPNLPVLDPHAFKPLNTDQQAIMMSKGFAERADNGDVIHTVKGESETLGAIAKWYAGAEDKAGEIARMNGLAEGGVLVPGARIRVPLNIIKELKAMPGP